MNFSEAVVSIHQEYRDDPMMVQIILKGEFTDLFGKYNVNSDDWIKVQKEASKLFYVDIINQYIDYRAVPQIDCVFKSLQDGSPQPREMHSWSFVYYHGTLQKQFDADGLEPGDLIQCSIDAYKFPLGFTRVVVRGEPALCYLWEEKTAGLYQDIDGNRYPRKLRHGLVIAIADDVEEHKYALKALNEQRGTL